MLAFGSSIAVSYLGLPKKFSEVDFSISTFDDFLLLLYDLGRYNLSLGSHVVCLDIDSLDLGSSFFQDVLEEERESTSEKINQLNLLVNKNQMRFCFFVDKFFFLGSQLSPVVSKTKQLLVQLSQVLDCIGIDSPSIIIRVGSAYGNRKSTLSTFSKRVQELDPKVIRNLAVTNDDKPSLFSITDLLSGVYYQCGVPICFRSLPHYFNNGGLSLREALFLSCSTWKEGQKPIYIYSEPSERDEFGFPSSPNPSGYLTTRVPSFGLDCDVILDSPEKETCLLKYLAELRSLPPLVLGRVGKE